MARPGPACQGDAPVLGSGDALVFIELHQSEIQLAGHRAHEPALLQRGSVVDDQQT